jgi:hypothetical protein
MARDLNDAGVRAAAHIEQVYNDCGGVRSAEEALRSDFLQYASTSAGRDILTAEMAKLQKLNPDILPQISAKWDELHHGQDAQAGAAHAVEEDAFDHAMLSVRPNPQNWFVEKGKSVVCGSIMALAVTSWALDNQSKP